MSSPNPLATAETRYRAGRRLCNAKQNTCGAFAMRVSTKCYNHGGAALRGIAVPALKHGRYAKTLPVRLVTRYDAALRDTDLLALNEEIALTDARIGELLTTLDAEDSGKLWGMVRETFDRFSAARAAQDAVKMAEWLSALDVLIRRGVGEYAKWGEVNALIEQRRRLSDSEQKRRVLAGYMVKADEATWLVGALLNSIRTHISDHAVLQSISTDFSLLVGNALERKTAALTAADAGAGA